MDVVTGAFSFNVVARQTLLTSEEVGALADDLLRSAEPPRGTKRFTDWEQESAPSLGRRLATGDRRPWPE